MPLFFRPYELQWQLKQTIEDTEVEDFENTETIEEISMAVLRDWHIDALEIPLRVGTAISFKDRELEEPYPEILEAREAGTYSSLTLGLIYDDVHNERYRRYGAFYSIEIERGFDWLGSDYRSTILEFQAIGFRRLNRYDNFNYRFVLGAANDSPYDYPYFGIGGASNIRGLESVDDRGDARVFSNLEYVFSYKRHPQLSHTLFLDIGNVYEDLDSIDLGDLHYTIGTGFRWKIESFVRTDLFLDYGYDVEENEGKLYGGTSLAF
jgi:outer membrane protein assembly factor BamA